MVCSLSCATHPFWQGLCGRSSSFEAGDSGEPFDAKQNGSLFARFHTFDLQHVQQSKGIEMQSLELVLNNCLGKYQTIPNHLVVQNFTSSTMLLACYLSKVA
jgi:hypothetical protein